MAKKVTKIGVLTSGGDAPGMNAAIRAVVRTALYHEVEVYGILRGYSGMVENDMVKMDSKSVSKIIQLGGTILKTARCKEFYEPEGRAKAYDNLKKHGIDGLVVIGGDGSFKGAQQFSNEFDIPCIGLPGTIDKDIAGTDFTIGFDTAVNTAVEAIDKIRDTMEAHNRLFVVEVMGRDAGYIALHSGMATGAENILIPERKANLPELIQSLTQAEKNKKYVNLIVVTEGDEYGGADGISNYLKLSLPGADIRTAILGHIQRGGSPTANDRIIASRMGYHAVQCLLEGRYNVMVGIVNDEMRYTPLDKAVKAKQSINDEWLQIVEALH
ncbi:MAG TPA: 6-phosphofructokinase [Chitinophagaceae bacterium]|jgi:6-phosphofructokinase 1|nr:6-phosphofructokinase [Chitinophagaceae bacterium]HMU58308.1 6-phosphofructokinase [Chitinophagaceae bacterium]